VPVVFDVNILVLAVAADESSFRSWPSPPPTSGNPSADCLGVINDAAEFALWLSPHILANTGRVLATVLMTPDEEVDEYLQVLAEMAEASGGGITDPPQTVGDCPDWEDNRILDMAPAVGAFLIVSADTDLTACRLGEAARSLSRRRSRWWSPAPAGHAGGGAESCRLRPADGRPG
jgi:predicted nucleic acid-binding protein